MSPLSAQTIRKNEANTQREISMQDKAISCWVQFLLLVLPNHIFLSVSANKFPFLPKQIQVGFLSLEIKNPGKGFCAFASIAVATVKWLSTLPLPITAATWRGLSLLLLFLCFSHLAVCLCISHIPSILRSQPWTRIDPVHPKTVGLWPSLNLDLITTTIGCGLNGGG